MGLLQLVQRQPELWRKIQSLLGIWDQEWGQSCTQNGVLRATAQVRAQRRGGQAGRAQGRQCRPGGHPKDLISGVLRGRSKGAECRQTQACHDPAQSWHGRRVPSPLPRGGGPALLWMGGSPREHSFTHWCSGPISQITRDNLDSCLPCVQGTSSGAALPGVLEGELPSSGTVWQQRETGSGRASRLGQWGPWLTCHVPQAAVPGAWEPPLTHPGPCYPLGSRGGRCSPDGEGPPRTKEAVSLHYHTLQPGLSPP